MTEPDGRLLPNGRKEDPTENVRELVSAEMRRQDDLREMGTRHQHELDRLRGEFARELRQSEAERINAIRDVDVGNVAAAASVAETRASTLAATVQATAQAFDAKLTLALEPITKRIEDLSQSQWAAQGQKTQVVEARAETSDYAPVLAAIESLKASQNQGVGGQAQRVESRDTRNDARNGIIFGLTLLAAAGLYLGVRPESVVVTPTPAVTVTVPATP